jgi:WD40 repeat protein
MAPSSSARLVGRAPLAPFAPFAALSPIALFLACSPAVTSTPPRGGPTPIASTSASASGTTASASASASATPKGPTKECLAATAQRARVPELVTQGKLGRAARVLERAAQLCADDVREGWPAYLDVLIDLDRFDDARAIVEKIDALKDAPPALVAASKGAKDRLAKLDAKPTDAAAAKELATARLVEAQEAQGRGDHKAAQAKYLAAWEASHPNGEALRQAGLEAKESGDPVAAQRLFDRAIVDLEKETGGKLALYTENGLAQPPADVTWLDGGKTLLIADGDDLLVLDALTWTPRLSIEGVGANIYAVAVSADGKTAACALDDGTVPIVDLARGVVVSRIAAHAEPVNGIAISADGKTVATASTDQTVAILDAVKGTKLRVLKGHTDTVTQVVFSPDGARVASGSNDGTVRTWEVATGKDLKVLKGHADGVTSLAWSPDGKLLATGAGDGVVRIVAPASLKVEKTLKGQTLAVSLSFSADGKQLSSTSLDETARVYEVAGWKAKTKVAVRGGTSAALAPDGRSLAVVAGPDAVEVYGVPKGALAKTIHRHAEPIASVAIDPTSDAATVALASWDGSVRTWKLDGEAGPETLAEGVEAMRAVAWSHDGRTIAAGGDNGPPRLWDARTRASLGAIKGLGNGVRALSLSANGARIAWTSGSVDRFLSVGDRGKANATLGLYGHKGVADAVDWAPDMGSIATGGDDTWLMLWDPAKGEKRSIFKGHAKGITAVAWSPDGNAIATGSADTTVRLWDPTAPPEKAEQKKLTGHARDVKAVAWSADGKRLVSGGYDRNVIVWEVATGASRVLEGHTDWVTAVAFTRDGKRVLSAGRDGTLRLFDADDGRLRVSLRALSGAKAGYAFTPEGLFEAFPKGEKGEKGSEPRRLVMCRIGARLFPLALCAERFVLDGLVSKIAAGDASYLDP